jgi:heme oxygenase (biliverdin-IX-beta and delta-forming)
MAVLRTATWPIHQKLEKRLDVKRRFGTLASYRRHLESMWGFCASLERRVAAGSVTEALADYESRRKLSLLTQDLQALGASSGELDRLPRCETLPECDEPAAALGCLYVLEGATLGGQTLLPLVQQRLGLNAANGAAFLASYGDNVVPMWRAFGAALDAWCEAPERRARAAAAAVETFGSLEQWLCRQAA